MCLITISYNVSEDYPLIIAANRDEYFARPSLPADYWEDAPEVLGGRDLEKKGGWFAVNKSGRLAAVTNYRGMDEVDPEAQSRGLLVSRFLNDSQNTETYLQQCIETRSEYSAFNLLLGDKTGLYFLSSREAQFQKLKSGIYGISNGDFDSDWPKLRRCKQQFKKITGTMTEINHEFFLQMLADQFVPEDSELPQTGVGLELERMLAPVFIRGVEYGTRTSTVLSRSRSNMISLTERNYDHEARITGTRHFDIQT